MPDLPQPRVVQDARGLPGGLVVQDVADGLGEPFGIEDDDVFQALVVGVVDDQSQVVHQLGQGAGFRFGKAVPLADPGELLIRDLRLGRRAGLDVLAGGGPAAADQLTHLRQPRGVLADRAGEPADALTGAAVDLEPGTRQHAGEHLLQVRVVQFRQPLGAMRRHYQRPGIGAGPQPDTAQPALHLIVFLALAGVPHHQVQGPAGQEELVADPVHLLAAEIPRPHRHIRVQRGVADGERRDLDAVRGRPPLYERLPLQRGDQRGLAHIPLADQDHLRLVLWLGIVKAAQVRRQLGRAARSQLWQRLT